MHSRAKGFGVVVLALLSAGIYACVGDDPAAVDPSSSDDGGPPGSDGGVGTDSQASGDGASDDGNSGCTSTQASCGGTCIDIVSNPTNCGRCGHDCGTGGMCSGSVCQPMFVSGNLDGGGGEIGTIATEETDDNPAAASAHVLWSQGGSVLQDNVTGGNRIVLSTGSPTPVSSPSIVVHGSTVYWIGGQVAGVIATNLYQATLGGAGTQASAGTMNSNSLFALMYDGTHSLLYGSYAMGATAGVFTCTTAASPSCSSATSFTGVPGIDVASDGKYIFLSDSDNNAVDTTLLGSTNSTAYPLGSGGSGPNLLRIFGTGATGHLFWSNSITPSIWRSDLQTTSQKQIATPATAADAIAVDASNVYWTESATGTLKYVGQSGSGSTTTLVTMGATAHPMHMVRDTQFLYFVHDTGIYRVALP